MPKLNVNPTRMELLNLKRKLATAKRGHKLLKDKQDELMRKFIELIRLNKEIRMEVEKELTESFKRFFIARALMTPEMLEEAVVFPNEIIKVDIKTKNVMSVHVPVMQFKREVLGSSSGSIFPYGYAQTSSELDDAIQNLNSIMPRLLKLAEVEKTCQLMADEIEKTRRRVNALEHRTIPDLELTIKYIRMKLDETERSTITRLMKVKDLINK